MLCFQHENRPNPLRIAEQILLSISLFSSFFYAPRIKSDENVSGSVSWISPLTSSQTFHQR